MKTTFLRFPSENDFVEACEEAGYWITEEPCRPLLLSSYHIFNVVGTITLPGVLDPETEEFTVPPETLEGFHVNAKLNELPDGWDQYVVTPSAPYCVFAGD